MILKMLCWRLRAAWAQRFGDPKEHDFRLRWPGMDLGITQSEELGPGYFVFLAWKHRQQIFPGDTLISDEAGDGNVESYLVIHTEGKKQYAGATYGFAVRSLWWEHFRLHAAWMPIVPRTERRLYEQIIAGLIAKDGGSRQVVPWYYLSSRAKYVSLTYTHEKDGMHVEIGDCK